MSMELVIYEPTKEKFLKEVSFNFDQLKTEITNRLEKYKGLVYTDDKIKEAKEDKATLNKFTKALNDRAIEIDKELSKPITEFRGKIKDLISLVEPVITKIDSGVKKFEEKQKAEKKETLKGFYSEYIGDLKDLVPFENLFNEKMLNVTVKLADSQKAILEKIEQINRDLVVIMDLKSAFELQIKDFYFRSFDLSGALSEGKRLEDQKKKMEELEAKRQAEIKVREEAKRKLEPVIIAKPVLVVQQESVTATEEKKEALSVMVEAPQIHTLDFRVHATNEQLTALKQFLTQNQIKFERI